MIKIRQFFKEEIKDYWIIETEKELEIEAQKYKTSDEFLRADYQKRIIAGQDLGDEIGNKVNINGTLTLYHGTSKQNSEIINNNGVFNEGSYFSIFKKGTEYGDSPIDVAKRKYGKDAIVISIEVDARGLESAAAGSEVYAPQKLIKQEDNVWTSYGVKNRQQLINIWNKSGDIV